MVRAQGLLIARVAAGLLSLLALVLMWVSPTRELSLFPHPLTHISAYLDSTSPFLNASPADLEQASLHSSVTPLNSDHSSFICDIKEGEQPHACGAALSFLKQPWGSGLQPDKKVLYQNLRFVDFSEVTSIRVKFGYRGSAPKLRLALHNAETLSNSTGLDGTGLDRTVLKSTGVNSADINGAPLDGARSGPGFSQLGASWAGEHAGDGKIIAAVLQRSELNKPLTLGLQEFSVPAHWVNQSRAPRLAAMPEFDNVFQLAIEMVGNVPVGSHVFAIESVEAIKPLLPTSQVYVAIVLVWLLLLCVELMLGLQSALAKTRRRPCALSTITHRHSAQEADPERDATTGLLTKNAITPLAQKLFAAYPPLRLSLSLINIDYLKHINNSHGDAAGDIILSHVGQRIRDSLRQADVMGYWSGGAYLLICQHPSSADAYNLAEKLRLSMSGHQFDVGDQCEITLTVSIGVCMVDDHEPFEYAFERAHQALQQAKDTGRNCVRMA